MRARDLMTRAVVTVQPQSSLAQAISLLVDNGYAALPVVDEDGRVVGILSESNALRAGPKPAEITVEQAMTAPVHVVAPSADAGTMAARMIELSVRSMPVVEQDLLLGIVSRRDLLRALVHDDTTIAAEIRGLLDDYAGSRRQWAIKVVEGRVEISGGFATRDEQRVVGALARTVEGVRHVDVRPTSAVGEGV